MGKGPPDHANIIPTFARHFRNLVTQHGRANVHNPAYRSGKRCPSHFGGLLTIDSPPKETPNQ